MNKFIVLIFTSLLFSGILEAQHGALGPKELQSIQESFKINKETKALMNAISNNDLKDLALNRNVVDKADHLFSYRVKTKGITNQKQSGRCWMFTGLNVLRPKVIEHYQLSSFEFSTNYLYFWDLLEKSNLFLQEIIATINNPKDDKKVEYLLKNVVGDGGVWNSLANLVKKYGAVPKSAMPETYQSQNTSRLNRILKEKLRQDALYLREKYQNKRLPQKIIIDEKITLLQDIYRILALSLGVPPEEFTWRYTDKDGKISELKKYTPKSFVAEAIPDLNLDNYVLLMNDPSRPYYKLYEIDLDRNIMEGQNWLYINLPAEDLKKYAIESIKNNEAMYASCDVGKQLNLDEGLLDIHNYDYEDLLGISLNMTKKQRINTFQSGSSHGMALVAVDVDKDGKSTFWQFENSWGATKGHNGYLTFTDEWFNEYMFRIVVLKKFVDEKTLKILKQKPILLPPWDPMFLMDK